MSKSNFFKQYLPRHPVVRPRRLANLFVCLEPAHV